MTPDHLDRLVLGCLLPGFEGTTPPEWLRRSVADGLAGIVLFARNIVDPDQLRELVSLLRSERADLVVAVDEEGGDVTRLEATTGSSYPGNLALGEIDDADLTRDVAASLGTDLCSFGIDLDLAPVVDVNSNPDNPVIGVRSFGSESTTVARHTAAFVTGLQQSGVAACAKHFPGHGDTDVDSHRALPVVRGSLDDALHPFRAAVDAGVRAVMTAHLVVDGYGEEPATVNPRLVRELLRERLGFRGAVISDGLDMAALSATYGVPDGAVRALGAGIDGLCVGGELSDAATVDLVRVAVATAVREGRLTEERLAEASDRLGGVATGLRPLPHVVDRSVGLFAARRAVRSRDLRPINQAPLVVQLEPRPNIAAGAVPWGLTSFLAQAFPTLREVRLAESHAPLAPLLEASADRPVVVVAKDVHRHPWMAKALAVVRSARPEAVLVEMGLPASGDMRGQVQTGPSICTFGAGRVNAQAASELLVGAEVPA